MFDESRIHRDVYVYASEHISKAFLEYSYDEQANIELFYAIYYIIMLLLQWSTQNRLLTKLKEMTIQSLETQNSIRTILVHCFNDCLIYVTVLLFLIIVSMTVSRTTNSRAAPSFRTTN